MKNFSDSNPVQYFVANPGKLVQLKTAYEQAVNDALKAQQVCFEGQLLDVGYCKFLLEAIDNTDPSVFDTARILNNLYGVEDDDELDDMFEGREGEG